MHWLHYEIEPPQKNITLKCIYHKIVNGKRLRVNYYNYLLFSRTWISLTYWILCMIKFQLLILEVYSRSQKLQTNLGERERSFRSIWNELNCNIPKRHFDPFITGYPFWMTIAFSFNGINQTNLGTLHPLAKVEVWVKGACARSKRLSKSNPCSMGSSMTICGI